MPIWMIGVDHNRAGLDVRSAFSFTKKRMEEAYAHFAADRRISGNVILSTCNRMEWWLSVTEDADFDPLQALCAFLQADAEACAGYFTFRREEEAVDHLFRLAAGLESRIIGEDQILTQVGDAMQFARACYAIDPVLEVLFRRAVTAGKRVKTETSFSTADRSVISTALRMLGEQGLDVAGRRCLVIGNGMMGRISAQTLLESGAEVTVTVRQYRSGIVDIPRGCERINYADRYQLLPQCDLVVSATSSPNYTLSVQELAALRPEKPICLVDLAVPRDIEPGAGELPGFSLYDIDSFRIDLKSEKLRSSIAGAEVILQEEQEGFFSWYEGRDMVSRIGALKAAVGQDVNVRMTRAYRSLRLEPEQRAAIEQEVNGAAQRMMNRLLFGMREKLPEDVFEECVQAMEYMFQE